MINIEHLKRDILSNGYHVVDNLLNDNEFKAILALASAQNNLKSFRPAKIGHRQYASKQDDIRNDLIYWLDSQVYQEQLKAYFQSMELIRSTLNEAFYLGLVDYEAHFSTYLPGSFYKKHIDQFQSTNDRKISCVYYLNPSWNPEHGGELSIYSSSDKFITKIEPIANRLVCFESHLPHEVHPTTYLRQSIAGWFKTRSTHAFI